MGVKGKCNHTWICTEVQGWEDGEDTNGEFLQGWMDVWYLQYSTQAHTRPGNRWEIPSSPARQVPVPLSTLQRREERLCLSSRFCHPTSVFLHSRSCNRLLQAAVSVWPKGVFPAWNRVRFSQPAHSVFSQHVLSWPQSFGELTGSKPVTAVAAGKE